MKLSEPLEEHGIQVRSQCLRWLNDELSGLSVGSVSKQDDLELQEKQDSAKGTEDEPEGEVREGKVKRAVKNSDEEDHNDYRGKDRG